MEVKLTPIFNKKYRWNSHLTFSSGVTREKVVSQDAGGDIVAHKPEGHVLYLSYS